MFGVEIISIHRVVTKVLHPDTIHIGITGWNPEKTLYTGPVHRTGYTGDCRTKRVYASARIS